ncbi:MAG: OmpA family protein [Flavobacteriales bacterium]|nr:OmpA family protein [Flavobacteriales bacterium]
MKRFFLLSLILFPLYFFGQSKQVWLYEADNYYNESDYASALKFYKKAQNDSLGLTKSIIPYEVENTNQKLKESQTNEIDSTTEVSIGDYLNHQIGMCYFLTYDYSHASNHFVKTIKVKEYPADKFYYALSLMNVEKYDSAMVYFENYIQAENKKDSLVKIAKKHVQGCYFALSDNSIKKEKVVTLADTNTFNKGTSSFAPMFWGDDKIMFTSARKGGVLLDREKQNSEYLCDLYWSQMNIDKTWSEPINFGRPLNSSLHDASGVFNNNNVMFFTKWSDENREDKNIYLARMIDLKFFESYKLDSAINVPGYKSINPFVTMDGSILYFSSNRPGGKGGMDLWKIEIDNLGNPKGKATNLGAYINTSTDEISPFFHEQSSTLFFSSNGHGSMGGLDIYKSEYDQENEFYGSPINMGAPINSSKDDAYMIWDELFKTGYLSSDRKPCENGHCYNIYKVENAPIKITIQGFVYDAETDDAIPEATITFKDIRFNFKPFEVKTNSIGFYKTELHQNAEVFMKAKKKGYFADAASADTRNITESTTLTQDFFLNKIPGGEIEIPGIEYDYDSPKLRSASKLILDTLSQFLTLNDNISIEIRSHTDSRGNDDYNLKLSDRRAASVVKYLVALGIDKGRLQSKGMGETEPLDDCSKYEDCGDTGKTDCDCHQKNRRTAFKTTSEDFKSVFKGN